jgi:hypothetical protein|nr:MAG TPA: RecT protein [Caudoviricetes sp.]
MRTTGGLQQQQAQALQNGGGVTLKGYLQAMMPEIKKALPTVMTPERFTRIVMTTISTNPALQKCTPQSFLGAVMQAAQLGVEPNTPLGQAYLIPYGNQVQFQLGYKGLIDLAYRSGEVKSLQAHEVYEHDTFEYELGLDPKLKHIPALNNRGNVILYYAVIKFKNGGEGFEVMSREDVETFAKSKSKTYGRGPWQTDFDEMAKKTVLKRVLKYAPMKTDFIRAVATDETVKSSVAEQMADLPDETVTIDTEAQVIVDKETGEVKS